MPLAPIAAALAPKAGAAVATALAVGSDELAHHVQDMMNHTDSHATAFLHLPIPKQRLYNMVVGPEVAAANWVQGKLSGLWHHIVDPPIPPEHQAHMVEYYAAGCPHCKDLDPVWKDAASQWANQSPDDVNRVVWEQKQCLDEHWKPGPDFQECQEQHIQRFPTVRFFAPDAHQPLGHQTSTAKVGEDFFLNRTSVQLVDFAKTGIHPAPDTIPRAPDDESDLKMVDFYAAACPHCKHLEPAWDDAHKQWDKHVAHPDGTPREDVPLVAFEKKECYDQNWQPGRDYEMCQKLNVESFPTVKLFMPDSHGHGFTGVNYEGDRTADAIVNFLKQGTGIVAEEVPAGGVQHQDVSQVAHGAQHMGPLAVKAEILAAGENVPASVKAAAAAAHSAQADEGDASELQGNTPNPSGKADSSMDLATSGAAAALPKAVAEAIRTATMPVPLMACLPARRSSTRSGKASARPPVASMHFI